MNKKYYPFSTENTTTLHKQQEAFLETAYILGFEPFMFGNGNFCCSHRNNTSEIITRGKNRWELFCNGKSFLIEQNFRKIGEKALQWVIKG